MRGAAGERMLKGGGVCLVQLISGGTLEGEAAMGLLRLAENISASLQSAIMHIEVLTTLSCLPCQAYHPSATSGAGLICYSFFLPSFYVSRCVDRILCVHGSALSATGCVIIH